MSKSTLMIWVLAAVAAGLVLAGAGIVTQAFPPWVLDFSRAVAVAERGNKEISSGIITRNNPGDIESAGIVITYPDLASGWNALYTLVAGMFSGDGLYHPDMSINEIAQIYVCGPAGGICPGGVAWAHNVASALGVSPNTSLTDVMRSYG